MYSVPSNFFDVFCMRRS
uniref:Uncharacterized protein n=1 Tax=Arundo donax TaxID=35708 RepID=A0A0A9ENV0_ARUDO